MNNQLDAIDTRILEELTADARISFVQLAKKLKVSNTLIHQRVKKLREEGILKRATYLIDPEKLGYETATYTTIMLSNAKYHRQVEEALRDIPEIVECVNISGRFALLVKIFAKNNRHLRDIIYEKIHAIEGIEGTNSTFSFETAFVRNVPFSI
ncbi:MAG: Lrp/AsnC family transcriptional regulator [Saprospiraceae bacterium]